MIHRPLVCLFFISLIACEQSKSRRRVPEGRVRPEGVPENAFFAGGKKGGHWFVVDDIHAHRNNAIIRIYSDQDGRLIVSKRFFVCCRSPAGRPIEHFVLIDSLQEQVKNFDGKKIYFKPTHDSSDCWMQY